MQLNVNTEKSFHHEPIDLKYDDLVTDTQPTGRKYVTPDGTRYPSITTILSILSEDAIAKWRARVGEEEANKVSNRASGRGTRVHEALEHYVNNDGWQFVLDKYTPDIVQSVLSVKEQLDKSLTTVYGQEIALYSDHLRIAGRVDCVGVFNGKPSIIDYKTSKKHKPRKYIENYFCQEAAYAIMWEERTGMPITQLVTVIAVDEMQGAPGCQVVIEHRDNWTTKLMETIELYEQRQNQRIG
jgi:genome maintenance exonuclease 1